MNEKNIERALEALSKQTPKIPAELLESMIRKAAVYEKERLEKSNTEQSDNSSDFPEDDFEDDDFVTDFDTESE